MGTWISNQFHPSSKYVQFQKDLDYLYRLSIYYQTFNNQSETFKKDWVGSRRDPKGRQQIEQPLLENVDAIAKIKKSTKEKLNFVSDNVHSQILLMFQSIHDQLVIERKKESLNCGFSLIEMSSHVKDGGNGVFMKGYVVPGTVVALYPGILVISSIRLL